MRPPRPTLLHLTRPILRPRPHTLPPLRRRAPHRHQSRYRYQTFNNRQHIHPLRAWAQRPTFYYEVGGLAALLGAAYTACLETVPFSQRRRFNVVSPEREAAQAAELKKRLLHEYAGRILPARDARVQRVKRVLARLLPAAGAPEHGWDVVVVADQQQNAFVIPGGTVFVMAGILDVCGDDAGVATVLGHEMAHALAHHAAERLSASLVMAGAVLAAALFGLPDLFSATAFDLAFLRPGSRVQEAEADHIGLLLMARACYDPAAAVAFWQRFEKEGGAQPPAFLSTHPSHGQRVVKIREWLPEAQRVFEEGGCARVGGFVGEFRRAWPAAVGL